MVAGQGRNREQRVPVWDGMRTVSSGGWRPDMGLVRLTSAPKRAKSTVWELCKHSRTLALGDGHANGIML